MEELIRLRERLREWSGGGIALGFSGGVDSALLLAVLMELRRERPFPLAVLTMESVLQSREDAENARAVAQTLGAELEFFDVLPLSITEVRNNAPERCYYCKKAIFAEIRRRAGKRGIACVIDGTNADDLQVFRPGQRALKELGVRSPLAELGLTKAQIRAMARELRLPCASRPASPCLATRFETGALLNEAALKRAGEGEALLRALLPASGNFRLRVHGGVARIEVSPEKFALVTAVRETLCRELHRIGFDFIALDLDGFRSGSMNGVQDKKA